MSNIVIDLMTVFSYSCACAQSGQAGQQCQLTCARKVDLTFIADFTGSADDNTVIHDFMQQTIYGLPIGPNQVCLLVFSL